MKKNVLITGAFGYLGGRIAKLLAGDPDVVVHSEPVTDGEGLLHGSGREGDGHGP
jgi:nucleoside-diphosphate-sugar epimerase